MYHLIALIDYLYGVIWAFFGPIRAYDSALLDELESKRNIVQGEIKSLLRDITTGQTRAELVIDTAQWLNESGVYIAPLLGELLPLWGKLSSGNTRIINRILKRYKIVDDAYMAFRSLLKPNDFKTIYRLGYLPDGYLDMLGEKFAQTSPLYARYDAIGRPDTHYLEKFVEQILIDRQNSK